MSGINIQDFDLFASHVRHRIKSLGDRGFVNAVVSGHDIEDYWDAGEYAHAFYLMAAVDYLCRINDSPPYDNEVFSEVRERKLAEVIYPPDVYIIERVLPERKPREDSERKSIPEFIKYGIVEVNIRDVA
jgi:hypothetical protein